MQKNLKYYAVGILIALGYYTLSMFLGSIINVLVSFTAGFQHFSDFRKDPNVAGVLIILMITLANHIFFAWVTAKSMTKYGLKYRCLDIWYFVSAAISVVLYALIIRLFTNGGGWLSYVSHSIAIVLFGRAALKRTRKLSGTTEMSGNQASRGEKPVYHTADVNTGIEIKFCKYCGAKLFQGDAFCSNCGKAVHE